MILDEKEQEGYKVYISQFQGDISSPFPGNMSGEDAQQEENKQEEKKKGFWGWLKSGFIQR